MLANALRDDRQSNSPIQNENTLAPATGFERTLWALVAVTLCADILSTSYGVRHGLTEGNPLIRTVLTDGGFAAFGVIKLAIVNLALSVWLLVPRPQRVAVPLGLSVGWGLTVGVNLVMFIA